MSNFLSDMKKQSSLTETANGAIAYNTTQNGILDFFAEGCALRNSSDKKIIDLFDRAYAEDKLLAMKCLFYIRDIRNGQGERRVFRVIIKHLAMTNPSVIKANLDLISEYGRYDDLLTLLDTNLADDVLLIIKNQLNKDINDKNPSLLAKWMPSCDTSSPKTRKYARIIMRYLNMQEKEYRKMLSRLRENIRVTERLITANRWSDLDLEKLTANNYIKYQNAFDNHIHDEWFNYINRVKDGNATIKSSTLYPYNIINTVKRADDENAVICDEMWKALPDYADGQMENALCMVDVSGSMTDCVSGRVTAMDVAISLGLYVSERVDGLFTNHFMTFSENPAIVSVKGETLKEKVRNMSRADWGMSTDLNRAFDLILETATQTNASQEEIPKKLIIISDMQFDEATDRYYNYKKPLFKHIEQKYNNAGYKMPTVVFWNVNSTKTAFQVSEDDKNVLLCSGCSPVILKGVLKYNNPMELVLETLNSPRYESIRIV